MKKNLFAFLAFLLAFQIQAQTVVDIVVNSPDHEILEDAVIAADLAGTLSGPGPFTLFAPTDAAFNALPPGTIDALLADIPALTNILLYHAVGASALSTSLTNGQQIVTIQGSTVTVSLTGGNVFINNAQVTVADIIATNGVVHVINAVLLPPPPTPATVVDVIVNSEVHQTLEAAVIAADLVATLSGQGPFTVFAPTDAAFAALPPGTVDALLADIPALTNILLYHVVGANAESGDLTNGQMIMTLQGSDVTVTLENGNVLINNALVTFADIITGNGIVHVIDAVLLPPPPTPATVVDIIVNSPIHETLEAAVIAADLAGALSGPGPFTVFAPTDEAFAALPPGLLEALLNDIPALTSILTYHVAGTTALAGDLTDGQVITTLNGATVTISLNGGNVFVNDAQVTIADLVAENGVVHVINAVLVPPSTLPATVVDIIVNSEVHETLETAVIAAGLVEALSAEGPFTVFAPTDAAFAALPEGVLEAVLADIPTLTQILLYHAVSGQALSTDLSDGQMITTLQGTDVIVTFDQGDIFINNARVIVADILAQNGVVHVIDAVLIPVAPNTVADIISNSPVHETLTIALEAAGLIETLEGDGPFTVFAPTDAAFALLPEELILDLLAEPQGLLTQILLYHVVGSVALSTDLSNGMMIETINGQSVTVSIEGGNVRINNALVIAADIVGSNGVVHVIDAVLIPEGVNTNDNNLSNSVVLYPNPAAELAFAEMTLENASDLTIRMMDLSGKIVYSQSHGRVQAGFHRMQISTADLSSGLYFVEITANNSKSVQKLSVK